MKKLFFATAVLLSLMTAETQAANDNTRMLIRQRTLGDVMGEASASKVTAEKVYYYNNKLQLRRIINTKPGLNNLFFQTTDYMNYEYEDDLLKEVSQWQYGIYTYGERDVKKSNVGNITYKYDAKGNCIEKNDDGQIETYEYDAQGRMVKMTVNSRTMVYDEFNADGKPTHAYSRSEDKTLLGLFYEEIYTYNANGDLVKRLRQHDEDLSVIVHNGPISYKDEVYAGDFMEQEDLTYDGTFLQEDITTDQYGNKSKIVYEMVDGNPNIIRYYELSFDPWGGGWSTKPTVITEDEYQDFSDYKDLENEIVSVTQGAGNTALVEFTLPLRAQTDPAVGMNVYRNGEFLQTFYLNDFEQYEYDNLTYNEASQTFTFHDPGLPNHKYEYFVETVRSEADGGPAIDDELDGGGMVTPLKYIPSYIVSNLAEIDIYTELPAATNLKAIYEKGNENVEIAFDAPLNAAMNGFKENWLMIDGAQLAESTSTDASASLPCVLTSGKHTIYVISFYNLGYALSESITVDINETPTAIVDINAKSEKLQMIDVLGRKVSGNMKGLIKVVK